MDYTTVKSYCNFSHLNYLGKVYENVVADMLSQRCKVNHVLHGDQKGLKRQRIVIDAVA